VIIFLTVALVVVSSLRSCDVDSMRERFDSTFDANSSLITLSGSATMLDARGGEPGTELVAIAQDNEGTDTVRRLARIRFAGDGSSLVWQSEPLDDSVSRAEVAVVGDTMFAGIEDDLYALDFASGETKWHTTLRDKVTTGCPSCFAAAGGRLIVRTADAYVTAFGPSTSEQQWSIRLNSPSGAVWVDGDNVLVVDDPEDANQPTPVVSIDPATGKARGSTTPTCAASDRTPWTLAMSPSDVVRPVAGSDDVVAAFGFGDGCVARWSPVSGKVRWTRRIQDVSSWRQDEAAMGSKDLAIASTSGRLIAVDLASGQARGLDQPADATTTPDTIVGRTLVATTATTRGTTRGGLAAWDLRSGDRLWVVAQPDGALPVSDGRYHTSDALFDGSPRSVLVPGPGGLSLFVFEGTEDTFTVAPIDLGTGDYGTQVRRAYLTRYDSGTSSLTVEGSDPSRLVISIDTLIQALPVTGTGEIVSFPTVN